MADTVLSVRPGPHEVAAVFVPPGFTLSLPGDVTSPSPEMGGGYATVPGTEMGWGVKVCWYGDLTGIRNGHHQRDRDVWHEGARFLTRARRAKVTALVYIVHEPRDWYGKTILQAVSVRPA